MVDCLENGMDPIDQSLINKSRSSERKYVDQPKIILFIFITRQQQWRNLANQKDTNNTSLMQMAGSWWQRKRQKGAAENEESDTFDAKHKCIGYLP